MDDIKVTFDDAQDIKALVDVGSIQYGQLQIGETKTGEAGTKAIVTNSGSSVNAVLNFTIPRGENGVYVGTDEPTDKEVNVWINPSGYAEGLIADVQVDGVSVVEDGIANINLSDLEDGYSPTATVTQTDNGATITITDKNGTTTSTILNGKDGVDGTNGVDGKDGAKGEKGDTGEQGVQGVQGEKGDKGDKGDTGEAGKDGVSVTHSWNGTTLTVTSASGTTSANLKGDKGDKGDTGLQGPKGDTGSKGDTGATGPKGDSYVMTEADKAEITRMVIESLGGNPVFGYVDKNNNIIVSGNLLDGDYTVSYEMENGELINIGNLVLDNTVEYSIVNNLTNCTNNNNTTSISEGQSYSAIITPNSGYELKSVSVTMGGSAVSVSGGVINIASVTGDIVIMAIAEEIVVEPTNLLPQATFNTSEDPVTSDKGYVSGYKISNSSGGLSQLTGGYASGFIPVGINETVTIKNISLRTDGNSNNIILYSNTNKASKIVGMPGPTGAFDSGVTVSDGVYSFTPSTWTTDTNVAYFRFSCGGITEATIVTKV